MKSLVRVLVASAIAAPLSLSNPVFGADQAATRPVQARIEQLISQFSDDAWAIRQQAHDEVISFGPDAVPCLESALKAFRDEEVRSRAEAALRIIAENKLAGPSLITMRFKEATAKEVFDEVARQAFTEFRTVPAQLWELREWPRVTIDVDRKPFWAVMRELAEKTGVGPSPGDSSDRRMTLSHGLGSNVFGSYSVHSGPFLIAAQTLHHSTSVNLAQGGPVCHDFSINLTAYSEPKIRVLGYSSSLQLEEVVDDKDNSLLMGGPQYESTSTGNGWAWGLYARLNYPANPGTKIAKLRGSIRFTVQTQTHLIEVPDILSAKDVTKAVAGKNFTVKRVTRQGDQYAVSLVIYQDGRPAHEWSQAQSAIYQNVGVALNDASGRPLRFSHTSSTSSSGDSMEMTYIFNRSEGDGDTGPTGEPTKLVWEIPLESKQISVPFEFTNLPMPR